MTYSIEFSYLQEFPQPVWRVVEKVESIREFKDHLQSPSFYPSIGCLCRLTDDHKHNALMLFCFDGENFIDIGDDSVVKQKTPWNKNGTNLMAGWLECEDPAQMLFAIHQSVDQRTLVKAVCSCVSHALVADTGFKDELCNDESNAFDMNEIAESWSCNKISLQEATQHRIREGCQPMNHIERMAYAALYTCENPSFARSAIQQAIEILMNYYRGIDGDITLEECNSWMADEIRDHISCYDFVMSLVKS